MPTRINKRQARKLFAERKPFYIQSCKMLFSNPWQSAHPVNEQSQFCEGFDTLVTTFEYYNCDYARGYYAAFYVD